MLSNILDRRKPETWTWTPLIQMGSLQSTSTGSLQLLLQWWLPMLQWPCHLHHQDEGVVLELEPGGEEVDSNVELTVPGQTSAQRGWRDFKSLNNQGTERIRSSKEGDLIPLSQTLKLSRKILLTLHVLKCFYLACCLLLIFVNITLFLSL